MTKQLCKISGNTFELRPKHLSFYKKVGVAPPTLCPEERLRRRLAFRNERSLYRINCDATDKPLVSIYSKDSCFPVYEHAYWWSDNWSAKTFGRDFDFSRPFFEQFHDLQNEVPKMSIMVSDRSENSTYSPYLIQGKNCYLCISGAYLEDCYYCYFVQYSKHCVDCTSSRYCELCYECIDCNLSVNY